VSILFKFLLVISFLLIVASPTLVMLSTDLSNENSENRNLAQFPNLLNTRIILLPDLILHFYSDHFGLRNLMIANKQIIESTYLKSPNGTAVIQGLKGIYFYNLISVKDSKRDYKTVFFSENELLQIKNELEKEYLWFKVRSIPYILVIGPDKEAIYPEYYPYPIILANLKLDQLESFLTQNSSVKLLDLRQSLMNSKKEGIHLYYTGDFHWNQYGAFLSYLEIMKKLRETNFSVYIPEPSDFEVKSLKDEVISTDILKYASLDDGAEVELKIVPKRNFAGEDKKLKKVFIYGDSFTKNVLGEKTTGLITFLPFSFESVYFQPSSSDLELSRKWLSPLEYDKIEEEKPDLVIRETVQHNLRILLGPKYNSL